ncbi:MAG: glucosaminidase domain-containing protein, partial [Candidatus Eremiobacteraeota bacterium]|nr:glucosaminidase domain-containing protein [Candidatus Eremiobacteraeota bacterium]
MNIHIQSPQGMCSCNAPGYSNTQPLMQMMMQMMSLMSRLINQFNSGGYAACQAPFGGMAPQSPGMNGFLGGGGPSGFGSGGPGPNTMSPPSSTAPLSRLSDNRDERIRQIVDAAKRTHPNHPHLAKLAAAQALLESGIHTNRPSGLARNHNNLFGIKGRGTAGTANLQTREHLNGRNVTIRDGFARNATLEDSFVQHRNLLTRNRRYQSVVNASSFEEAAVRIRQAGYATAPNYTSALLSVYRTHLARYF